MEPAPFPLPELAQSLTSLPGVGPATAQALAARGLHTWGDLLFFFPSRYQDRRKATDIKELTSGSFAVVRGVVLSSGVWGRRGKVYRIMVGDDSGRLTCLWFRFNRPQLEAFKKGDEVYLAGLVSEAKGGGVQMAHPEVYLAEGNGSSGRRLGRVLPIYPEVAGVRQGSLQRIMEELVQRAGPAIPDPLAGLLPGEVYPLSAGQALTQAHTPPQEATEADLDPDRANWRRCLALNELLYFELGLKLVKEGRERSGARVIRPKGAWLRRFVEGLPFELTEGQKQAIKAIRADMARSRPMARMLAGDVGTGKTLVACAAALLAAEAGVQTAFMAPTGILARQHMETLRAYLEPLGVQVALATGSMNGAQKKDVRQAAQEGAALVVGTHALLSQGFEFRNLGLVIIDEQHRFGVEQRLKLAAKGQEPHLLVLSATPIPRTLALALAGHLDISDLPQKPRPTPPIKTSLLAFDKRKKAVDAVSGAVKKGRQAYVVCPLVEESQNLEAQDAVTTHRRLAQYFPQVKVGLLHGRMDAAEQQRALGEFKDGLSRILVATTVVEVGVDVPAASLMVVLAAERFGLSQLHQLRGRVGRGDTPGACILVAGPEPGELAEQRLNALCATTDGLAVAEADLHLRGPGEALGVSQSGLPPFRVARWDKDAELAPVIRKTIAEWLAKDPDLTGPKLEMIKAECLRRWGKRLGLTEAG